MTFIRVIGISITIFLRKKEYNPACLKLRVPKAATGGVL